MIDDALLDDSLFVLKETKTDKSDKCIILAFYRLKFKKIYIKIPFFCTS